MSDPFDEVLGYLAANVLKARAKLGLTQSALAERSEIDVTHVQRLESASANPTLKTLCRLAVALDMSCEALLCKAVAPGPRRPGRPSSKRTSRRESR
jgi:transcriptional regulator with XRE-family HTH domain